jgi:hypothetical protein
MATAPKDNPWENLIKKANRHTSANSNSNLSYFPKAWERTTLLGEEEAEAWHS